ncbi:MAG: sulfate adenylyltransferase subunit CysN [Bacteroidales bacterium]|nr:sulfate adenylyltransferase subunit CysN [Bacteroidales bacterium]
MQAKTKLDINEFLSQDEKKDMLRLLTAGSVDDGKSTLIGRLLFDSKKLYEDQLDALERDSKRVGNAGDNIDYALLLDGLKAEREQGITIDVAYRYFSTNKRKFIIADTPGHEQYTRNMITGGSTAALAIILVDARSGVITQTRRHSYIVSLLGIKNVVLAVNKMDLVGYDKKIYDDIVKEYRDFTSGLNIPNIYPIPLSALKGDNVVEKSGNMSWYTGLSLLDYLENVEVKNNTDYKHFRYPVQYVLRPNQNFRGFSGKIASGVIRKGDEIMALPSGKRSKVKGIHVYEGELQKAFPPQCVTLTLEDEIDISRGEMIVHPGNLPNIERRFEAMLVWMDEEAMDPKRQYFIKHTTNLTKVSIDNVEYRVDINTLEQLKAERLQLNEIGKIRFTANKPLFFDPYQENRATGAFILIDPITNYTCGAGMIIDKIAETGNDTALTEEERKNIIAGNTLVSAAERMERYGHKGTVISIEGTPENTRTIGYTLERRLFAEGFATLLFDCVAKNSIWNENPALLDVAVKTAEAQGLIVLVLNAGKSITENTSRINLEADANPALQEIISDLNKL